MKDGYIDDDIAIIDDALTQLDGATKSDTHLATLRWACRWNIGWFRRPHAVDSNGDRSAVIFDRECRPVNRDDWKAGIEWPILSIDRSKDLNDIYLESEHKRDIIFFWLDVVGWCRL